MILNDLPRLKPAKISPSKYTVDFFRHNIFIMWNLKWIFGSLADDQDGKKNSRRMAAVVRATQDLFQNQLVASWTWLFPDTLSFRRSSLNTGSMTGKPFNREMLTDFIKSSRAQSSAEVGNDIFEKVRSLMKTSKPERIFWMVVLDQGVSPADIQNLSEILTRYKPEDRLVLITPDIKDLVINDQMYGLHAQNWFRQPKIARILLGDMKQSFLSEPISSIKVMYGGTKFGLELFTEMGSSETVKEIRKVVSSRDVLGMESFTIGRISSDDHDISQKGFELISQLRVAQAVAVLGEREVLSPWSDGRVMLATLQNDLPNDIPAVSFETKSKKNNSYIMETMETHIAKLMTMFNAIEMARPESSTDLVGKISAGDASADQPETPKADVHAYYSNLYSSVPLFMFRSSA